MLNLELVAYKNEQGQKTNDDTEKSEISYNFFTSVFTNEQSDPTKFEMKADNNVSEILVTKEKVLKF